MKKLLILLGILLLVGTASAVTWTSASGCWTATDGAYSLVKWNATGTSTWITPGGVSSVEYLVVGGGGGGAGDNAGGGGAGGFKNGTGFAVSGGITVVVGSPGSGGSAARPSLGITNGTASNFSTIGVSGGGKGSAFNGGNGSTGASGGGGGANNVGLQYGGSNISGEGFPGGNGAVGATWGGGGGGGASQQGGLGTTSVGGRGGNGTASNITGTSTYYSGGGGGGSGTSAGVGGLGGGGNGGVGGTSGANATNETGGGGGGGSSTPTGAGGNGGSGVVIIKYLTPDIKPIPSFTKNSTGGVQPLSVQFNDTSVTSITNWSWNFGEGNTSTIQNATNTFYNGNHYVTLNVTNASGSSSTPAFAWINVSASGGLSGWNRQDIMMDQIYTFTLNVKDSVSLSGIPGATVATSNGDNTTTSVLGVATISTNYTALVVQVGATGYLSRTISYVVDRDRTETIYLTRETISTQSQNVWWTPHMVQITIMDNFGQRLTDVSISAKYNSSSMPTEWLTQLYGIQATPAADMINSAISLNGTTGSDGTLTTTMLGSLKYDILLNSVAYGLTNYHVSVYPSDPMLNIYVATAASAFITDASGSLYTALNGTRVYFTEPDIYNVSMCINYVDTKGLTTSVNESWYYANNNTMIFSQVLVSPGTTANLTCITLPNVRGTQVYWGWNASRSV